MSAYRTTGKVSLATPEVNMVTTDYPLNAYTCFFCREVETCRYSYHKENLSGECKLLAFKGDKAI